MSLAKAWRAIRRFSEDIDITYDIRAFAPDLAGDTSDEALPPTRSQEQRRTKAIRNRLAAWVREQALPTVEPDLARAGHTARLRAEGGRLYVGDDPTARSTFARVPDLGERQLGQRRSPNRWARRIVSNERWPAKDDSVFFVDEHYGENDLIERMLR